MRVSGWTLLLGRIVTMLMGICLLFQVVVGEGFGELLNDETFHTYASKCYVTQSDVSRPFSKEIGLYMDEMNKEYCRGLAGFVGKSKKKELHVRIYKTEGSYRKFTGESISVGVFMPSRSVS